MKRGVPPIRGGRGAAASLSEWDPRPGWQGAAVLLSPLLRLVEAAAIEAARRTALGCLADSNASVRADRWAAAPSFEPLRRVLGEAGEGRHVRAANLASYERELHRSARLSKRYRLALFPEFLWPGQKLRMIQRMAECRRQDRHVPERIVGCRRRCWSSVRIGELGDRHVRYLGQFGGRSGGDMRGHALERTKG